MSEEEKAIETLKEVASDDFDTLGDDISPKMAQNILNLIEKQQRKLKEVEDYVTSHDFFNLLCTPYTPGKRKPYFIAHDNLLAILQGDNKE